MTDRTEGQASIDALAALDGAPGSINPSGLAAQPIQEIFDRVVLQDEFIPTFQFSAESFVDQQPIGEDIPLQYNFDQEVLGGDVELLMDGTVQCNSCEYVTIGLTAQYGREGSSGTSHLYLFASVNPFGSADPAADIPIGKNFYAEISNANSTTPLFAQNFKLQIPVAGFQLKFWIARDSTGNNSGGLIAHTPSFTLAGNAVPVSSSAGITVHKDK